MSAFTDHIAELRRRWSGALASAGLDVAVVAAGTSRPYFLDDQSPPYRPNPHFAQWLAGAECPNSLLLVRRNGPVTLYFHQVEDYWHLPPATPDLDDAVAVETFDSIDAMTTAVAREVERFNRTAFVGEVETPGSNLPFGEVNPPLLLNALHYGRARKTPFEIACMRRATEIAVAGHVAAVAAFRAGASEFEIHQAYLSASQQTESSLPYSSIVALNEHAGVLHYQHYDRNSPAVRKSFLIDAGGRYRGYAADVTRTYAAQSDAFAALIDALDAEQLAIIDTIRAGMSYVDLHDAMHRSIAGILSNLGLVTCSAEAAYQQRITDAFFPHGIGHLIGLQTHDVGGHLASPEGGTRAPPERYPALRLTRAIETGQVFTVEPGIYFIPMLLRQLRPSAAGNDVAWSEVDALMGHGGIRIEDNVLITEDGVENLTREAFAGASSAT